MKRFTLLLMLCLLTLTAQAQENDTYLPFVQEGKVWRLTYYIPGDYGNDTIGKARYRFHNDEVVKNGKSYLPLYYEDDDRLSFQPIIAGLFREEDKKVYRYDEDAQTETLLYDFSLKVGDTFTYQPDEWGPKKYKVIKEDTIIVNGHHLRELTIKDNTLYAVPFTLTECIGCLRNPLEAFKNGYNTSYHLAYVQFADETFLPFSITDGIDGWRGQQLVHDEEEKDDGEPEELYCELVMNPQSGTWLHVQGNIHVQCGPNNYIYCKIQNTEKPFTLSLEVEEAQPLADCVGLYHVDQYFDVYSSDYEYVEFNGKRYPIANHIGDYSPFIAENKVWKVGWFPDGGNVAKRLANYYFDGDTIMGGQTAKRLMCEWQAAPDYVFEDGSQTYTEYVAALYETGRRVYFALPGQTEYKVLYDFGADVGSSFVIGDGTGLEDTIKCTVMNKGIMDGYYYKGNYVEVNLEGTDDVSEGHTWLEGVGCTPTPLNNHEMELPTCKCDYIDLMSCVVGDEVIYQNEDSTKIDGLIPTDADDEAKRRIDFTHVVKIQPKYPRFLAPKQSEEQIKGEYSLKQLVVNLGLLSDTYDVSITASSGKVVYQKEIKADKVIALNIDISTLTGTNYTLTLENDKESFTGLFYPSIINDIETSSKNDVQSKNEVYDLTGRRVSTSSMLQKGIYIQNGHKLLMK